MFSVVYVVSQCSPPWQRLAFVAPLVGVFIIASKTTDAFQMAKWSSRNVIPAKIALGILFALLGALVLPRFGAALAELVGNWAR